MKLKQHREKNNDKGSAKKRRTSAVVSSNVDDDVDNEETTPSLKKKTKNGRTVKLVSMKETPPIADGGAERRPKHVVKFANAKGNKAKHSKPFKDWEDPVWVYHEPTPKIWNSRVEATFYRIAGIYKPAELLMLDGKSYQSRSIRTLRRRRKPTLTSWSA
jgi:hypothetical protein